MIRRAVNGMNANARRLRGVAADELMETSFKRGFDEHAVFCMPGDMEMNFGVDVIGHRVLSKANGEPSGGVPAARRSRKCSRAVSPLKRAGGG